MSASSTSSVQQAEMYLLVVIDLDDTSKDYRCNMYEKADEDGILSLFHGQPSGGETDGRKQHGFFNQIRAIHSCQEQKSYSVYVAFSPLALQYLTDNCREVKVERIEMSESCVTLNVNCSTNPQELSLLEVGSMMHAKKEEATVEEGTKLSTDTLHHLLSEIAGAASRNEKDSHCVEDNIYRLNAIVPDRVSGTTVLGFIHNNSLYLGADRRMGGKNALFDFKDIGAKLAGAATKLYLVFTTPGVQEVYLSFAGKGKMLLELLPKLKNHYKNLDSKVPIDPSEIATTAYNMINHDRELVDFLLAILIHEGSHAGPHLWCVDEKGCQRRNLHMLGTGKEHVEQTLSGMEKLLSAIDPEILLLDAVQAGLDMDPNSGVGINYLVMTRNANVELKVLKEENFPKNTHVNIVGIPNNVLVPLRENGGIPQLNNQVPGKKAWKQEFTESTFTVRKEQQGHFSKLLVWQICEKHFADSAKLNVIDYGADALSLRLENSTQ